MSKEFSLKSKIQVSKKGESKFEEYKLNPQKLISNSKISMFDENLHKVSLDNSHHTDSVKVEDFKDDQHDVSCDVKIITSKKDQDREQSPVVSDKDGTTMLAPSY